MTTITTAEELRNRVRAVEKRRAEEKKANSIKWVDELTPDLERIADCGITIHSVDIPLYVDFAIVKATLEERGFEVRRTSSILWIEWPLD